MEMKRTQVYVYNKTLKDLDEIGHNLGLTGRNNVIAYLVAQYKEERK